MKKVILNNLPELPSNAEIINNANQLKLNVPLQSPTSTTDYALYKDNGLKSSYNDVKEDLKEFVIGKPEPKKWFKLNEPYRAVQNDNTIYHIEEFNLDHKRKTYVNNGKRYSIYVDPKGKTLYVGSVRAEPPFAKFTIPKYIPTTGISSCFPIISDANTQEGWKTGYIKVTIYPPKDEGLHPTLRKPFRMKIDTLNCKVNFYTVELTDYNYELSH